MRVKTSVLLLILIIGYKPVHAFTIETEVDCTLVTMLIETDGEETENISDTNTIIPRSPMVIVSGLFPLFILLYELWLRISRKREQK